MEWAKTRTRPRIDLAGSNLLACSLSDLPGAREALEISGESPDGYPPLLGAIAERYGVRPDSVATAGGCSGATFLVCAAMLGSGDEAVIESPGYDPLVAAVRMVGARPRFFARPAEEHFALDAHRVAAALTPATRLVIVSNPHNPSGVLASEGQRSAIARLAEETGVPVLFDEVYLDAVSGPVAPPAARLSPLLISSNSLTKSYGLSALRCGWTLASPEITQRIRRARDVVDVSGPIPAERLAVLAFENLPALRERARRLIETNRTCFGEILGAHPALHTAPSVATIAFPLLRSETDAEPFARRLLSEHGVAVVPGAFFGCPGHFRVSLGGAPAAVREGLEAIALCLAPFRAAP